MSWLHRRDLLGWGGCHISPRTRFSPSAAVTTLCALTLGVATSLAVSRKMSMNVILSVPEGILTS